MHKICFIFLTSCLLQSLLCAMDLKTPQQLSPKSRRAALVAELEAQREYEYQLEEQLYNGEISQSEHDAYYDNRFLAMVVHIVPTQPHIDAANNCGQTCLHLAVIFAEENDPTSLDTCRSLVRQGARIDLVNSQCQTPLHLAAVHKESVPLTTILLTECPSVKPALKTILLSCRRWGITMPKDVFFKCIVPYVIFNATESKLAVVKPLVTEVLESKTVYRPNPMAGRNVTIQTGQRLCNLVKNVELQQVLDPKNIEQLRSPITNKLYASIDITRVDKKDENNA